MNRVAATSSLSAIGSRNRPSLGLLRPAPRHMAVEPIGHRRRREQRAGEPARIIALDIEGRDDDRDRQDARQGQQIGQAGQRHASLRRDVAPRERGEWARRIAGILAVGMEMIINLFCDGFADAADPLDLGEPGARHGSRRAEMMQQRVLALGADAGDLVERRAPDRLGPLGAMRADREAVRLVAQPLQEIEHRIARLERERRPARAGRTARGRRCGRAPWRSPTIGRSSMPSSAKHLARRRQLALAAVDQHQVGPCAVGRAPGSSFSARPKRRREHLAHHRVIVAAGRFRSVLRGRSG